MKFPEENVLSFWTDISLQKKMFQTWWFEDLQSTFKMLNFVGYIKQGHNRSMKKIPSEDEHICVCLLELQRQVRICGIQVLQNSSVSDIKIFGGRA